MRRMKWAIGVVFVLAVTLQFTLLAAGAAPGDNRAPDREPASIQLTPDPRAIDCDGAAASTITVRVTDTRGRAVRDGTLVSFDATYGFVDPVEDTTTRGEATTQVRLYSYAANFPGDTAVQVVAGGLRASIGIDCAPAGPPCNPLSPPAHPMSPPCEPLPCSDTDSPPVGTSPPCATPCHPASPPQHPMSPPCDTGPCLADGCQNEIWLDSDV